LGDTTKIVDLKSVRLTLTNMLSKINFLEVFLNYSGDKNLSADFTIAQEPFYEKAFSSSKNGSLKCTFLPIKLVP
jgi:hypothetical protein